MIDRNDRAAARAATPAEETSGPLADAQRTLALVSIGGLFLVVWIVLIALSALNPTLIFVAYAFMLTVSPLLAGGVLRLVEGGKLLGAAALAKAFERLKSFLLCLVVAGIAAVVTMPVAHGRAQWLWGVAGIAFVMTLAALLFARSRPTMSAGRWTDWLDGLLVVLLACGAFILSPFDPAARMPIGYLAYAFDALNFGYWAILGIFWVAVGFYLMRVESRVDVRTADRRNRMILIVVVLFVLSLYDDGHYIHIMSYEPLVDPAMQTLHGGIPMVDTYSQYGFLTWFVYYLSFLVLPGTFGTSAVVLRLINLAYFLVILAMLVSISRRRLSVLWFLAPAYIAMLVSHDPFPHQMWNVYAFPMMMGGRWLVPSLMALSLVIAQGRARATWSALLLIALAAVSSMEILAYTLATWGYCMLLEAIRQRSIGLLLKNGVMAILAAVAGQAVLFGGVYAFTGKVVDYAPYLSILSDYRPVEGTDWSMTFEPLMALWFPVAVSYFAILATAGWRAFRAEQDTTLAERLLPVALFGLGPLGYFFGRPQEPGLTLSCLPFAVVVISVAQVVFREPARFGGAGRALAGVMAFSFAFTIGTALEHYARPYEPTSANSSILRRCFTPNGCLDALHNIHIALTSQALDPRTSVGQGILVPSEFDTQQRIEELISMLQRLAPDKSHVGMVTDFWDPGGGNAHAISVAAAMATGNWRMWFYTAAFHDGQAKLVADRVLRRVAATPPGTLVIISNRREGLIGLNQEIIKTLEAHCRLSPVETAKYHTAYRVIGCDGPNR